MPPFIVNNGPDGAFRYAKKLSDLRCWRAHGPKHSNRPNGVLRKLGLRQLVAPNVAGLVTLLVNTTPLANAVVHIGAVIPKEKMLDVEAFRVVARVTNMRLCGDCDSVVALYKLARKPLGTTVLFTGGVIMAPGNDKALSIPFAATHGPRKRIVIPT